jgi:hypothetical protein
MLRPTATVRVFDMRFLRVDVDSIGSSPAAKRLPAFPNRSNRLGCMWTHFSNVLRMVSVRDLLATRAAV